MNVKTKASVIVLHRRTARAYSYNDAFEILEPLMLDLESINFKRVREYWKPMCPQTPMWAMGVRDIEFDTFFLR